MKKLVALIVLLFAILITAPVYAFTEPTQGTDNATDTILWHGDSANVTLSHADTANVSVTSANVTITSANVTITLNDFQDNIELITTAITEAVEDITVLVVSILLMLGLAALGYWRGDKGLFVISGLAFLLYSFSYWSTSWQFGLLLGLAGAIIFLRAFSSKDRE